MNKSLCNQPVFPEDEQYTCSHCGKTYASQGTLHVHMAQVHSTAKPFQCDLCPRSYKYKKSLRIHKVKHQGMAQTHQYFFIFRLLYQLCSTMLFKIGQNELLNDHINFIAHTVTLVSSSKDRA